ncbi:MAG: hypothetical protein GOVbin3009_63 [Prokaryotic dsDNA virus sp.]|jgi:hypothetical protein|nr:MAG: hypothetical protein GOVbin3009_63 [Prokaryotic dsDNA virus sp.]|tara:strand:- start:576 stop:809 length:234 start_codon:yes stop_codon:yes gene_type:complete
MKYNYDDIEKIAEFKSWSEKRKIDELLRIDCIMYTNMGSDSTKKERLNTKKRSRSIYRLIQKINPEVGKSFLYHMDS